MRPVQALLMTRATREAQLAARPNIRPFTVSRAGGPGLQRYAQTWSGDNTTSWESLSWNFRTGLGMSLSGLFNIGHDIGGFAGPPPDPELLIRWTQAGLLHPRFLMNSWKDDGVTTSPWLHRRGAAGDPRRAEAPVAAHALSLQRDGFWRTRRMSRCWPRPFSSSRTTPPHSPTPTPRCSAPACSPRRCLREGAREVEVYLPRGPESWRDVWTGRVYAAGRSATIPAPLERLPLLAPAGAIVATTDSGDDFSRLHDEPSRALRVFPGAAEGASRAVLFEDDGISLAGASTRVTIALSWTASRVRVEAAASGDYPLPYQGMRVILPADETRAVEMSGSNGIGLRL